MTIFDDNFWCQFWWQFWWLFLMTSFDDNFWMTIFFGTYFQLVTCDIWDTDYNTDNWEPRFITIFVTWQVIVTLDSICNSCDALVIWVIVRLDLFVGWKLHKIYLHICNIFILLINSNRLLFFIFICCYHYTVCEEDAGTAGILMVSSDIPRDYFPPCTVTLDFFRTFHKDFPSSFLLFLLLSYFHKFSNILQLLGIIFPPCSVWRYPKFQTIPIPILFSGTKYFRYRYRYFFRYQIFPIPVPRLFSDTKF